MRRISLRPLAEGDVLGIWEYIAADSEAEADLWLERLNAKFALWASQPMMGRARDELHTGLRSFPFARYIVFYLVIDDGIEVVRVLHGSRDVQDAFEL